MFKILLIFILFISGCSNAYNKDDLYMSKYEEIYNNSISIYLNDFQNEKLYLTYKNNTNQEVSYGKDYTIEVLLDNKWYIIPNNESFIEISVIVMPYKTSSEEIDLKKLKLKKGQYRLIKTFNSNVTYPQTIEFSID